MNLSCLNLLNWNRTFDFKVSSQTLFSWYNYFYAHTQGSHKNTVLLSQIKDTEAPRISSQELGLLLHI